jgi:DNA gyrase/topoisomerase IV subunit B
MYIGDGNDPRQLLSEIFDNAIDEVQAGYSPELRVYVDTVKNQYRVRDFGRGIPHGTKTLETGEQKEILEILITKSNSGGKFDNSSYNYSSGLNGLGLTITNALSTSMSITSYRKGKFVKVVATNATNVELTKGSTDELDGTEVVFTPDSTMFKSAIIPVSFIESRCKIASALGFRARLIVDGKEIDTNSTIFDLITEEDDKIATYVDIPEIRVENSQKEVMKVALRYTSDTKDRYFGFTNLLSNYLGGTHVQALSKTLTTAWETFISKHKNLRPAIDLKPSDYLVGLRGICAVFISKPEFSSQTKEKLVVNRTYFDELMEKFNCPAYVSSLGKDFLYIVEGNLS